MTPSLWLCAMLAIGVWEFVVVVIVGRVYQDVVGGRGAAIRRLKTFA